MDKTILEKWAEWNAQDLEDHDLKTDLESMEGNTSDMTDCFYRDLEFGTGGLRGIIGAGTNRMNIYTVAKATQGYANYLNKHFSCPTVAIAYDSRIKSQVFSQTAAEVFAANKIPVFIYDTLMPTPALSFAVRHLTCAGGIVITASHNPGKYNGYKVYGADGCQITTQAAEEIQQEIKHTDMFHAVKKIPFHQAFEDKMITYITKDTVTAYINAVSSQSLCGNDTMDKDVSIVYTPLNGAGLTCVIRCLKENGFTNISVVKEQENPDGHFPTCPYPNPEIREALELGLRDAKRLGSDLLLATDPDCDRVGIAVKSDDDYVLLSGNEVGMLLLDYICKRRMALNKMPKNPVMVKTIVTIDMVQRIGADYGVEVIDVLTGFKFIGEQIGFLEAKGEEDRYIFGFEESYGYLTGSYVRDKDAVNGSLMICEMFAYYKTKGLSVLDVLNDLYENYGFCLNTLHSYEFQGAEGFSKMKAIMEKLRKDVPKEIAGRRVLTATDYLGETGLPKSDVLKFLLAGNASVVLRPSGTEPKLKLYLSVNGKDQEEAAEVEKKLIQALEYNLQ